MGLILDSSVVIAAERRGDTIERLIQRIVDEELLAALTVYPFTTEAARVAGKLDGGDDFVGADMRAGLETHGLEAM